MKQSEPAETEALRQLPIGVFDSGLGGLSVLKHLIQIMPSESYVYYGDSLHAPYGTRSLQEVRELTMNVVRQLLEIGIKGLVVACNTATSASVRELREKYPQLIVVGIEPAIKPATMEHPEQKVLVMATPFTLKEEKFLRLSEHFGKKGQIIKVPCDGLVEYIERGELTSEAVKTYLLQRLSPYLDEQTGAVVLGCTHYPFIKGALKEILPPWVDIYDGGKGTARELQRRLTSEGLCTLQTKNGDIFLMNSKEPVTCKVSIGQNGKPIVVRGDYPGLMGLSLTLLQSDR